MSSQDLLPLDNPLLNQEAFDKWIDYRKNVKKKPIKNKEGAMKEFCEWPLEVQAEAVKHSTSSNNEYQGIFFEEAQMRIDKRKAIQQREAQTKKEGFMARHTKKDWARGL